MADLISMLAAASGIGAEEADPNFNQTVLLLHGDGTNGAQNNTFLDGSTNNFTITRNGNTTQGTFSPFSVGAGEWSNYFDGSGDFLDIGSAANWKFLHDGSSWTIEFFVYHTSTAAQTVCGTTAGSAQIGFICGLNSFAANEVAIQFFRGSSPTGVTSFRSNAALTINKWNHVAITFDTSGKTCTFYIDGVQQGSSSDTGFAYSASNPSNTLRVGSFVFSSPSSGDFLIGYLSNLRISSTVRTGLTTVPTTPYTNDANTSLLTCQSNRFVDNSTNAFAITRNGDVKVTPFSPFAPTAAYSAGTNGGSGYFDGSGDYLSVASATALNLATGAFTIEAWVYLTASAFSYIFTRRASAAARGFILYFDSSTSKFIFLAGDTNVSGWEVQITSTNAFALSQWVHVAVTRNASNVFTLWVNGTSQGTATNAVTIGDDSSDLLIGGIDAGAESYTGYLSSGRIVKGRAVYTSTFTPPTAPLGTTSGGQDPPQGTETSLLLNFTNAGIIDNTGKNVLETVGNAQIDTAVKKYGTGSLEFDGTGDWLLMPNTPDQQLGTGNFTIEFWVYLASGDTGSARGLVAKGGASTGWLVSLDSSQKVVFTYTTSTITSSGAITTNAWNHIAVVRSGTGSNQTKIYIGGTNDGTGTVSTDFNQTSVMYVGANRTGGDPMKGFIDDLRVTKGVARYTANFTPPTAAFPNE